MLTGQCLCGAIRFQINQNIDIICQCHCSLCRKQSGAQAIFSTMVAKQNFEWVNGEIHISTYKKTTGFTSNFCKKCGSPVPDPTGKTNYIWLPLGLIETEIYPTKKLNFCLSSKANWEDLDLQETDYDHLPSWDEMQTIFK